MARTFKYKSQKELQAAVDSFFIVCGDRPTISGLAYKLGFTSRTSLYNYEQNDQFSDIIKRAMLRIESIHEEGLFDKNAVGHIFWLKNRGWKDSQQVEQNTTMIITDNTELGLP